MAHINQNEINIQLNGLLQKFLGFMCLQSILRVFQGMNVHQGLKKSKGSLRVLL